MVFDFLTTATEMSRKGKRKPIKVISSELWKNRRKKEHEDSEKIKELRSRRAKFLVKQLRRAAKKGKTTAVRKAIRSLAAARQAGKNSEHLESIFQCLKSMDLDLYVYHAVSKVQNIDLSLCPLECQENHPSPVEITSFDMISRTGIVQQQLVALSDLFNPSEHFSEPSDVGHDGSPEETSTRDKKQSDEGSDELKDECMKDVDSDTSSDLPVPTKMSKRLPKHQKKSRAKRQEESESEPEDVTALIGGQAKNRPGQRTRRKMILQKYGRGALVFQKERERQGVGKAEAGEGDEPGVHPSWAAKRREKAAVAAALHRAPKPPHPVSAPPPGKLRADTAGGGGKGGGDAGVLHPSWQAKLRAKEAEAARVAAAREGKPKLHIKFDD